MKAPVTLVTGATGFAGSHLVDRLASRVPVVAWHRPGRSRPVPRPAVAWQAVDLLDRPGVQRAIADARPSRVYHVAGAPRLDTSWQNVVPHLETNVLGTHHLLDAIRESGEPCRVLVVSSGMVYCVDNEGPVTEEAPLRPSSPYGLSKLAQDQLALRAWSEDGLDVVVARPFNHAGPRQDSSFAVSSFARQIAVIEAGRAPGEIHVGNLDVRRDLTDVRDVVDAYEKLMDAAPAGRPYNICSGRSTRIGDMLDSLLHLSRARVRVIVDQERLRPSDSPVFVGDAARIRLEVGWAPQRTLTETLRDTLDWWRGEIRLGGSAG